MIMKIDDLKNTPIALTVTQAAYMQIMTMYKNDYTLEKKYLRLSIKGKGCEGFTYAITFTELEPEDIKISLRRDLEILLDPFTAKFARRGAIDFIQSHVDEGFAFFNEFEFLFTGKFFKDLEFQNI